jgi:hypothetical protein
LTLRRLLTGSLYCVVLHKSLKPVSKYHRVSQVINETAQLLLIGWGPVQWGKLAVTVLLEQG